MNNISVIKCCLHCCQKCGSVK